MSAHQDALAARLRALGMHFDSEQLQRVEDIVRAATDTPQTLADISLMTIAVEAYRSSNVPMREIV
ncbi:MAG: hypothetical protein ACR2G8_03865 [Candidatus Limnocylindria bacterium]|nr:hypothetical protein [Chloroflexota bacterium]MDQ3400821.1 hypothetical protein [Chloroflexota bacterium]